MLPKVIIVILFLGDNWSVFTMMLAGLFLIDHQAVESLLIWIAYSCFTQDLAARNFKSNGCGTGYNDLRSSFFFHLWLRIVHFAFEF